VPEIFDKLEAILPDSKYLTGDSLSIYDFTVAGFFCNIVLNPNH
jgi:glutathione S-transferase